LSPASVWLRGGDESPYSYGDGDYVSRVDSSGHSWGDAFLHYAERGLTAVANGMDAATTAAQMAAAQGVPGVSQVAGAWVYGVRSVEATTGTALNGDALSRVERVQRGLAAV
jgi:hypothetical protein